MIELLPYYALFYVVGLILMGLFVRFYLYKKRLKKHGQDKNES